jgi:stearoyl-CoA desaturase (delta-9 desaturase)
MTTSTNPNIPVAPSSSTPKDLLSHPDNKIFTTTLSTRLTNVAGVVLPLVGIVIAIVLLWGIAFSWVYLGLLVGMYMLTALGITVGYHRYFTHRSFDTPRPVAFILAAIGGMAAEGSVLEWTAIHRRHHQHSDQPDDPHSPHTEGTGFIGVIRGFWHAHVGWIFDKRPPGLIRYVGDLRKDAVIRAASKLFPLWVLVGVLIPAVLGGLLTMSWTGVFLGALWGGVVRVFLVHHLTWSINSICHIWGSRPFESRDESRNNVIFGIIGLGEGWHNNHHAFPTSARHGLRWWQVDVSYLVIRLMGLVGLARNIKVPALAVIEAKRRSGARARTLQAPSI